MHETEITQIITECELCAKPNIWTERTWSQTKKITHSLCACACVWLCVYKADVARIEAFLFILSCSLFTLPLVVNAAPVMLGAFDTFKRFIYFEVGFIREKCSKANDLSSELCSLSRFVALFALLWSSLAHARIYRWTSITEANSVHDIR